MRSRPTQFLIALLALVAAIGCGDSSGPGKPEDPGLLLVPPTDGGYYPQDLVWTSDGSELVYIRGYFVLAHRWEGNSPQLLSSAYELTGGVRLYEVDGLTGTRRDIAQFNNSTSGYIYANWSPDGQRLAAWIHEGLGATRTTSLYIIRPGVAPAIVATVHGDPGPPVFSPNGNSVAYFYYHANDTRSLYLKPGI
jgi:Tol biopolymer transport system component